MTLAVTTASAASSLLIGAVYPTGGSQAPGGTEEFHGLTLAAAYTNEHAGIHGRSITVRLEPADSWDAAPGAVERLAAAGATIVVGSYGSTISHPAASTAARLGLIFWETGAVGQLSMDANPGSRVFRVPPTGGALGRAAVAFVRDRLAPEFRLTRPIRYGVTYVDDVYGRTVGEGALAEIRASGRLLAGAYPYDLRKVDYADLVARIAGARIDVLVVGAYLEDGVALRRAILRAGVPLLANIGTSSSFCMPEFGRLLGAQAVGVFASDKPDGDVLRPDGLSSAAAEALRWGRAEYRRRYGAPMTAPGLSGFAGGLALFEHVLPASADLSPAAVARAAQNADLPMGSLPNGSGLRFAPPGSLDAGANLRAMSVIWEWVGVNTSAVVWPPTFSTHAIVFP
jgi:branched-chain amino acid transport system substrate-binding protein